MFILSAFILLFLSEVASERSQVDIGWLWKRHEGYSLWKSIYVKEEREKNVHEKKARTECMKRTEKTHTHTHTEDK